MAENKDRGQILYICMGRVNFAVPISLLVSFMLVFVFVESYGTKNP